MIKNQLKRKWLTIWIIFVLLFVPYTGIALNVAAKNGGGEDERIQVDFDPIFEDIDETKKKFNSLKNQITELSDYLDELLEAARVCTLSGMDFEGLKNKLSDLKSQLDELKNDVKDLQSNQNDLKAAGKALKQEIKDKEAEQKELEEKANRIKSALKDINRLKAGLGGLIEGIEELETKLKELEELLSKKKKERKGDKKSTPKPVIQTEIIQMQLQGVNPIWRVKIQSKDENKDRDSKIKAESSQFQQSIDGKTWYPLDFDRYPKDGFETVWVSGEPGVYYFRVAMCNWYGNIGYTTASVILNEKVPDYTLPPNGLSINLTTEVQVGEYSFRMSFLHGAGTISGLHISQVEYQDGDDIVLRYYSESDPKTGHTLTYYYAPGFRFWPTQPDIKIQKNSLGGKVLMPDQKMPLSSFTNSDVEMQRTDDNGDQIISKRYRSSLNFGEIPFKNFIINKLVNQEGNFQVDSFFDVECELDYEDYDEERHLVRSWMDVNYITGHMPAGIHADVQTGPGMLKLGGSIEGKYNGDRFDLDCGLTVRETFEYIKDSVIASLHSGSVEVEITENELTSSNFQKLDLTMDVKIGNTKGLNLKGTIRGKYENSLVDVDCRLKLREQFTYTHEKVIPRLNSGSLSVKIESNEFKPAEFQEFNIDVVSDVSSTGGLNIRGSIDGNYQNTNIDLDCSLDVRETFAYERPKKVGSDQNTASIGVNVDNSELTRIRTESSASHEGNDGSGSGGIFNVDSFFDVTYTEELKPMLAGNLSIISKTHYFKFNSIGQIETETIIDHEKGNSDSKSVFEGQVTYIEPLTNDPENNTMTISAYDVHHRLRRGTNSRTWGDGLNMSSSMDISNSAWSRISGGAWNRITDSTWSRISSNSWGRISGNSWNRISDLSASSRSSTNYTQTSGGAWGRVTNGAWDRVSGGAWGRIGDSSWSRVSDSTWSRISDATWGRIKNNNRGNERTNSIIELNFSRFLLLRRNNQTNTHQLEYNSMNQISTETIIEHESDSRIDEIGGEVDKFENVYSHNSNSESSIKVMLEPEKVSVKKEVNWEKERDLPSRSILDYNYRGESKLNTESNFGFASDTSDIEMHAESMTKAELIEIGSINDSEDDDESLSNNDATSLEDINAKDNIANNKNSTKLEKAYFRKYSSSSEMEVLFNPVEVSVKKTVPWNEQKKPSKGRPKLQFTSNVSSLLQQNSSYRGLNLPVNHSTHIVGSVVDISYKFLNPTSHTNPAIIYNSMGLMNTYSEIRNSDADSVTTTTIRLKTDYNNYGSTFSADSFFDINVAGIISPGGLGFGEFLFSNRCIKGQSYGSSDSNSIWVINSCEGEFGIQYKDEQDGYEPSIVAEANTNVQINNQSEMISKITTSFSSVTNPGPTKGGRDPEEPGNVTTKVTSSIRTQTRVENSNNSLEMIFNLHTEINIEADLDALSQRPEEPDTDSDGLLNWQKFELQWSSIVNFDAWDRRNDPAISFLVQELEFYLGSINYGNLLLEMETLFSQNGSENSFEVSSSLNIENLKIPDSRRSRPMYFEGRFLSARDLENGSNNQRKGNNNGNFFSGFMVHFAGDLNAHGLAALGGTPGGIVSIGSSIGNFGPNSIDLWSNTSINLSVGMDPIPPNDDDLMIFSVAATTEFGMSAGAADVTDLFSAGTNVSINLFVDMNLSVLNTIKNPRSNIGDKDTGAPFNVGNGSSSIPFSNKLEGMSGNTMYNNVFYYNAWFINSFVSNKMFTNFFVSNTMLTNIMINDDIANSVLNLSVESIFEITYGDLSRVSNPNATTGGSNPEEPDTLRTRVSQTLHTRSRISNSNNSNDSLSYAWWGQCNSWISSSVMEPESNKSYTRINLRLRHRNRAVSSSDYQSIASSFEVTISRIKVEPTNNDSDQDNAVFWLREQAVFGNRLGSDTLHSTMATEINLGIFSNDSGFEIHAESMTKAELIQKGPINDSEDEKSSRTEDDDNNNFVFESFFDITTQLRTAGADFEFISKVGIYHPWLPDENDNYPVDSFFDIYVEIDSDTGNEPVRFIPDIRINLSLHIVDDEGNNNESYEVKVKFPWIRDQNNDSEDFVTTWVRITTVMGGHGNGTWFLPEVDDEVLVAFELGDARTPFIIGMLYNGVDKPPSNSNNISLRIVPSIVFRANRTFIGVTMEFRQIPDDDNDDDNNDDQNSDSGSDLYLKSTRFKLSIESNITDSFSELDGLNAVIEVLEYQEGGGDDKSSQKNYNFDIINLSLHGLEPGEKPIIGENLFFDFYSNNDSHIADFNHSIKAITNQTGNFTFINVKADVYAYVKDESGNVRKKLLYTDTFKIKYCTINVDSRTGSSSLREVVEVIVEHVTYE
jgi:uncharacterized protein YlxW (UPF0749 family)